MKKMSGDASTTGDENCDVERELAVRQLLADIEASAASGEANWWDSVPHGELGGRTVSDAWRAGDNEAVIALVALWYHRSIEGQRRMLLDESLMAELRRRADDANNRYGPYDAVSRSA